MDTISTDGWVGKEVVWVYVCVWCTMEYYSAIKLGNPTISNNTDEPWGHYAKWNESDREDKS